MKIQIHPIIIPFPHVFPSASRCACSGNKAPATDHGQLHQPDDGDRAPSQPGVSQSGHHLRGGDDSLRPLSHPRLIQLCCCPEEARQTGRSVQCPLHGQFNIIIGIDIVPKQHSLMQRPVHPSFGWVKTNMDR